MTAVALIGLSLGPSLVACSKKLPVAPEADPAKAVQLAAELDKNAPFPAAVPDCKPENYEAGVLSVTRRTLMQIAQLPIKADAPELEAHVNPVALDHPSLRALADPATPEQARRQAAAVMLAARQFFVYHPDVHNAPLLFGINELKRGHVAMRGILYAGTKPVCVRVFSAKNTHRVSESMMDEVEKTGSVSDEVKQTLRDDMSARIVREAIKMNMPRPPEPASAPAPAPED